MVESECVIWTGLIRPDGYGQTRLPGSRKTVLAHRVAWFNAYGFWPKWPEEVLDHLCRNRACVNVQHLEVVSIRENILRGETRPAANAKKTICKRNHDPSNWVVVNERGNRRCRACAAFTTKRKRATRESVR